MDYAAPALAIQEFVCHATLEGECSAFIMCHCNCTAYSAQGHVLLIYLMQQNVKGALLLQGQGKIDGHKAHAVRGSQRQQPS